MGLFAVHITICSLFFLLSISATASFVYQRIPHTSQFQIGNTKSNFLSRSSNKSRFPAPTMSEFQHLPDVNDAEQRLRSLMMNSAQPQEGTIGREEDKKPAVYRDVRDMFPNSTDDGNMVKKDDEGTSESPQDGETIIEFASPSVSFSTPKEFRKAVREGKFTGPTNGKYFLCTLLHHCLAIFMTIVLLTCIFPNLLIPLWKFPTRCLSWLHAM